MAADRGSLLLTPEVLPSRTFLARAGLVLLGLAVALIVLLLGQRAAAPSRGTGAVESAVQLRENWIVNHPLESEGVNPAEVVVSEDGVNGRSSNSEPEALDWTEHRATEAPAVVTMGESVPVHQVDGAAPSLGASATQAPAPVPAASPFATEGTAPANSPFAPAPTSSAIPTPAPPPPAPVVLPLAPASTKVTTSAPYDCDAGFANWAAGWSEAKKIYCCHTDGRGCSLPVHSPLSLDPCDRYPYLKFLAVERNNLGQQGPDEGPEGISYRAEDMSTSKIIDVRMNAIPGIGDYTPYSNKFNGLMGSFGRINLKGNSGVSVKLSFADAKTGKPVSMPSVALTFLDLDHDVEGKGSESVTIAGFSQVIMTQNTKVNETRLPVQGNPKLKKSRFAATAYGDGDNNPEEPIMLTQDQKDHAVTLMFEETSSITAEIRAGHGEKPRIFEFIFRPTLICAVSEQEHFRPEPRLSPIVVSPGESPVNTAVGCIFKRWYAQKGDFVNKNDMIAEVKTAYGNVTALLAPVDGIVVDLQEGLKAGDNIDKRLQEGQRNIAVIGKIPPLDVELTTGEAPINAPPDVIFDSWAVENGSFVDAGDVVARLLDLKGHATNPLRAPRAGVILKRQEVLRRGMSVDKVMMDYDLAVIGTFPQLQVGPGEGGCNALPGMTFKEWNVKVGEVVNQGDKVAVVTDEYGGDRYVIASKYGIVKEKQEHLKEGTIIDEVMADRNLLIVGKHPDLTWGFREAPIEIDAGNCAGGAVFLEYLVKEGENVQVNQKIARVARVNQTDSTVDNLEVHQVSATSWGKVVSLARLKRGQVIEEVQNSCRIMVVGFGPPWWIGLLCVGLVQCCCLGGLYLAMSKQQAYAPMVDLPKRENTPPMMEPEPAKPPLPPHLPPLPSTPAQPPRPPPPPGTRLDFLSMSGIHRTVYARYRPLGIKNVTEAPIVIRPGCFSLNSYLKQGLGLDDQQEWQLKRIDETDLRDRTDFAEVNALLVRALSRWPMWPLPIGFKTDDGQEFKKMFTEQRLGMLYSRGIQTERAEAARKKGIGHSGSPISPIKVTGVREGSPAERAGVQAGWYIVQIGEKSVDRDDRTHDFQTVMSWLTEGVTPLDWPECPDGGLCRKPDCLYRHPQEEVPFSEQGAHPTTMPSNSTRSYRNNSKGSSK